MLVSDFYAAHNALNCDKQRCLVHLLRELARLHEELPWQSVRAFIRPVIKLFGMPFRWARTGRNSTASPSAKPTGG